ncbi:SDR family oxidoreductase [Belnapia rosea]|uniref:NADP-dependent 3-hydroxy acid dehydrogenase YdfG n=1 Tax=Belnapia rosea TaxID=938405 RepID=A0A1G6QWL0_9PROT|nr:SDR family oxidoreductase [Belnapia rosea]SDB63239.1 NADP-dependent 3-hydroxy acid dehydrogenase YdfG [Belnapia rosea]SDC96066.1 NADP-dependent 3-hydroxy acid dehydrogenase YdfG [Belnapia rosea]
MTNPARVIVITGASSGIGRATALAFARRGGSVVLAARRLGMLQDAARDCEALGGTALAVQTDVTDLAQVEALGRAALERFGRIDLWFNNAGIAAFGRLESIPDDVWRRVVETNLFGTMHGARVAMRQFRQQGHGVLVQNASIVGRTAKPDGTPYASSKFAIRGFSEALRQEVLDQPGIQVCTVLPSVIDTPFFQHAANFSGRNVQAAPPIYTAEEVAETVVALADSPQPEVIVGGFGQIAALQERLAPTLGTWFTGRSLHRGFLSDAPSGDTSGALFSPIEDGRAVDGGWRAAAGPAGAPLAALTSLAALPLAWAALPWRLADTGLAAGARMMEAMAPALRPGPVSK